MPVVEEKEYTKSSDGICLLLDNPENFEELHELHQNLEILIVVREKVQPIIEEFQLQDEEEEDTEELKRKIDEINDQQ